MEFQQDLLVRQARLALGGRAILRGVDLHIPAGSLTALLGASGCGKTSLLRAVAGLVTLDAGQILIGGRDVGAMSPQARGVGVVFQHYALFPNLTVLENIKFGPLAQGQSQRAAAVRARDLLELVELEPQAERLPAQLSGGQRQRVALARALASKPGLLLLDEPFSALDESFRVPLRRSLRQLLHELGQTCLLVTHDRDEAMELADEVAVMFDGAVAQCAAPLQLWRNPGSRQVAEFLGAFNRIEARSAPGPLRRAQGSWMAPISAFSLGDANSDDFELQAVLQTVYVSQQHLSLELRASQEQALVLHVPHATALPAPGARMKLRVPLAALQFFMD